MKNSRFKKIVDSIDRKRDYIIDMGENIYKNPEVGFKEFKTNKLVSDKFRDIGLEFIGFEDIPGLKATIDTGKEGPSVAVLGELDAVVCFDHPDCNKETGAVHACGHNTQVAAMLGSAVGIINSGIINQLKGKIHFIAVPAEEYIEVEYRMQLREKGVIKYLAGKPELMRRGFFDDVDMCIMAHSYDSKGKKVRLGPSNNGCIVKKIKYTGKAAHAGGSPHEGINALYAANIGLMAVNALRETFREREYIRVHPIITKGGDIVNVIPSDVRLETFVRGKSVEDIMKANQKINRALAAGALAMGAKVEIEDIPGYFPLVCDENLLALTRDVIDGLVGKDEILERGHGTGSTDLGDLSMIMPVVHPYIGGAEGGVHSAQYRITDVDTAYLLSSKYLACMVYELLKDNAVKAKKAIKEYEPAFSSMEKYFQYIDGIFSKRILPKSDIV